MKIVLDSVIKSFGKNRVIDNVSLQLESGKIYGFYGINGSGKTMLMRLISGLVYPTSGKVIVDGIQLVGQNNFPDSMGLLIDNPAFLEGYSGYKNLCFLAEIKSTISKEEVSNSMLRLGLNPIEKKKYRKYSLGMKRRLGIACAIMEKPKLLILDEPFVSLDSSGVALVKEIILEERKRGALVLLTCHDHQLLCELADEVFCIVDGSVCKDVKAARLTESSQ